MEELDFIQPRRIVGKMISAEVLDKIRSEIVQMPTISPNANDIYKTDVLAIIEKYKAESEERNENQRL